MESNRQAILLGILIGAALLVLVAPPLLFALYQTIRHRRGRWFRRSTHRNHH
jgi:hypothetical protein